MLHDEHVRLIKELCGRLDSGTDVGLSRDLPEPGSFLTNNDLGIPILATRDRDGTFKAFVNSCRHRGAIVETEERANAGSLEYVIFGRNEPALHRYHNTYRAMRGDDRLALLDEQSVMLAR